MFAKSERVELAGAAGKFKGFPVTGVRGQLRGGWGAWRGQLGGQGGCEAGLDFTPDFSSFPPPPAGEVEVREPVRSSSWRSPLSLQIPNQTREGTGLQELCTKSLEAAALPGWHNLGTCKLKLVRSL